MRIIKTIVVLVCALALTISLVACGNSTNYEFDEYGDEWYDNGYYRDDSDGWWDTNAYEGDNAYDDSTMDADTDVYDNIDDYDSQADNTSGTNTSINNEVSYTNNSGASVPALESTFESSIVPEQTDDEELYVVINDNTPYFTNDQVSIESYEYYSDLDELGRVQTAVACLGYDLMPTEERGDISSIKPTGWVQNKYDFVNGGYLYNRCHLIAFELAGENANEKNLATGTRTFNVSGMLPFENMVADYIRENQDNHVMYRITPVFEGDNLLMDGLLMEALSAEDGGDDIEFCVFVYNSEPGVVIDYTTGDNWEV